MIELHFAPTPNGQKISIALEEAELPYRLAAYDIFEGDHLTPAFGRINPNYKLPAIVDLDPAFAGGPHAVFESAAILQYIAEKSGRLLPEDPRQRSVALQWLTWQAACLGPMGGQASHFIRYAPQGNDYAVERYRSELERLLRVLDRRLSEAEYLAGESYSIADIAVWPGRWAARSIGLAPGRHPHIDRWLSLIAARPAVKRGLEGARAAPAKYLQTEAKLTDDEWSNMFGQRMHAAPDL